MKRATITTYDIDVCGAGCCREKGIKFIVFENDNVVAEDSWSDGGTTFEGAVEYVHTNYGEMPIRRLLNDGSLIVEHI